MPDADTIGTWRGHEVIDRDGEKIGKIAEIYLDRHTDQPAWVTVKTGLFGRRETLVPINDASSEGEIVRVPFEKEHVKGAPHVDPEAELSGDEERELHEHYGLDYSSGGSDTQDRGAGAGQEHEGGQDAPGERGDAADQARSGRRDDQEGAVAAPSQEESGAGHDRSAVAGQEHEGGQDASSEHGGAADQARSGRREEHEETVGRPGSHQEESDSRVGDRISEEPVQGERGETRLRLKRYVVTEEVRVPVQREEVRLERDDEGADEERPS